MARTNGSLLAPQLQSVIAVSRLSFIDTGANMNVQLRTRSTDEKDEVYARSTCQVLIIEDDYDTADSLVLALACNGYGVRVVDNRASAIHVLRRQRQDVILMDLRMPGLGAREFLFDLQSVQPECEVVLMTAEAGAEHIAAELGIQHWIEKPFQLDDVLEIISRVARQTHATK
ncbi:MAG TPA: response regulator [Planctomycetota bacterium]